MTVRQNVGVGNPFEQGAELRAFRAAWAKRLTQPVNVVCLGDSITQGYWASHASQRWFELFLARLMQNNGQQVPIGWVPLDGSGLASYIGREWTRSLLTQREHFEGPSMVAMVPDPASPGPAGTASYSGLCDRLWVFGTSYTSFTGVARITIDGGSPSDVNFVTGVAKGSRCWDSGPLSRGTHTVSITSPPGAFFGPIIEGCVLFDGNGPTSAAAGTSLISTANAATGSGLRIWNFSHNGYTTLSWSTTGAQPWHDCFDYVRPDLVTILLGCNDEFVDMTLADFRTNLKNIISQMATANAGLTPAKQPPSVVLIGMFGTGANASAIPPYNEVMRQVAIETGSAYVNWYDLVGHVGQEAVDYFDLISSLDGPTDGKHPSDQGHQLLGDSLAQWLTNAIGPTGVIPRQPVRKITAAGRTFTDGVTTASSTTMTSAAGASFQTTDVGKVVNAIGVPVGTTISARASTTSVTLSAAATLTTSANVVELVDPITNPAYLVDNVLVVDTTTVSQPIQLPSPVGAAGQEFTFKKTDATSNRARLWTPSGTIDGGAEYDLATQHQTISLKSDGTNYHALQPYRTDTGTLLDTGGETNMSRAAIANITTTATTQNVLLTPFIAARSEAITKVRVRVGGTAAATVTLIKCGIYQADKNGNLWLIASTANTTTMTGTINAAGTLTSLTTTFNKIAGRLYCTAFLFVGTTAPALWGGGGLTSTSTAAGEPFTLMPFSGALRRTGQTDLPTSITKANLVITTATQAPYMEMHL